jgi:CheY-like chemotaxis protein
MPKTILVVDDEPVIVEIAKRKLSEIGYEVRTAGDGLEALKQLKEKKPDLILLDIQMPNMNGYTFMMEKTKMPDFAKVPVIVLTAYAEMEPLFKRHGASAYVLKPLKLQDVIELVKKTIGEP